MLSITSFTPHNTLRGRDYEPHSQIRKLSLRDKSLAQGHIANHGRAGAPFLHSAQVVLRAGTWCMVAEINLRSIFSKVALFLNMWEVPNPKGALDSRSPLAEGSAYSVLPANLNKLPTP